MRPYLQLLLNWRIDLLMVLATVALALILCECEDLSILIATKLVGFAIAYGCHRLAQNWDKRGLIDELNIFNVQ